MKSKYGIESGWNSACGFWKKYIAIRLDSRNRIIEYKNSTLYKDDEKLKTLNEMKDAEYISFFSISLTNFFLRPIFFKKTILSILEMTSGDCSFRSFYKTYFPEHILLIRDLPIQKSKNVFWKGYSRIILSSRFSIPEILCLHNPYSENTFCIQNFYSEIT